MENSFQKNKKAKNKKIWKGNINYFQLAWSVFVWMLRTKQQRAAKKNIKIKIFSRK